MTTNTFFASRLGLALLLAGAGLGAAQAQTNETKTSKDPQVSVKIIERTDAGEVRELNRTYKLNGMKDAERDAMVDKLVDSLRAKRLGKGGQMTIIIEEDGDGTRVLRRDSNGNRIELNQNNRKRDAITRRSTDPMEFRYYRDGKLQRQYRFDPDSMADRLKRFEFNFPNDWSQRMDDAFRGWNFNTENGAKAATVRSLQVYPNNPDQHELNVRFTAPAKGDVKIRVTTPDGKEVARKDIKDFSGAYSGQLDLGRRAKGVYFVSVTQNEDGAVKRVVLPE